MRRSFRAPKSRLENVKRGFFNPKQLRNALPFQTEKWPECRNKPYKSHPKKHKNQPETPKQIRQQVDGKSFKGQNRENSS